MKHSTTSTAAVLAVVTTMAAFAAGSASASTISTVFCGQDSLFCPNAGVKPAGTQLVTGVYSGMEGSTNLVVEAGQDSVTCNEAVMTAKTTAESGDPLPAKGEDSLVGENCHANIAWLNPPCTSASMNNPPENIRI